MNIGRLKLTRRAARVQRFHTMPTLYRQSVGEHTFNVLSLIYEIAEFPSTMLVRAALYSDVPEAITGDIPSTAKWRHPPFVEAIRTVEGIIESEYQLEPAQSDNPALQLSERERLILKFCDLMEMVFFAIEEAQQGNRLMHVVARDCLGSIRNRKLLTSINSQSANDLYSYAAQCLDKLQPLSTEELIHGRESYF